MALLVSFYAGFSILLILLSIPMIRGQVKPNGWYGFRISLTLNNPAIWYPVNKLAGKWLLGYSIVLLLVSLMLPVVLGALGFPTGSDLMVTVYSLIVTVIAVGGIILVFIVGWRYAQRLDGNKVP